MNQKYLQGLSSNMESPNEAVFFEATPENITAFLMQHQWAQMSAIGTVDDRSFLTARMGLIDTCPDQAYFCLLYTSPSPRDRQKSRMPSSA